MFKCIECDTIFDADELNECPNCGKTAVTRVTCPIHNINYDIEGYPEGCPDCHDVKK